MAQKERIHYDSKLDFILSSIGFAVDLANVWRFPYLCYKYGGGAFLIPYFVMNIFQGIPLLYLEQSVGQLNQAGPVTVWDICPIARGLGIAQVMISLGMFYYNIIIAWAIFFFFNSFTVSKLPWMTCNHEFNTEWCRTPEEFKNLTLSNNTGYSVLSAVEYFERGVLSVQNSPDIQHLGSPRLPIAMCFLVEVIFLYFALWKGVKTSGKVVYVTAILPYVIMLVLLINGLLLPGAKNGISYFITPDASKLGNIYAWLEAAIQVFYSTGAGFGVHLTLASYSTKKNNIYRDTFLTVTANILCSLLAGFVVFAYLGYMSEITGKSIENVAYDGPGLVFQIYPIAIGTLPLSQLWSILFFLLLINLGFDSTIAGVETFLTGIGELLQKWFEVCKGRHFRKVFTGCYLLYYFFISLILCTPGGIYVLNIQNNFVAGISLIFNGFVLSVAISWFYGLDQFCYDIKNSLGFSPGIFWRVCWKFVSPAFILVIIIVSFVLANDPNSFLYFSPYSEYHPELFSNRSADNTYKYFYPSYVNGLAWFLCVIQIVVVFVVGLVTVIYYKSFTKAITPIYQHGQENLNRNTIRHWFSLGPNDTFPLTHCPCPCTSMDVSENYATNSGYVNNIILDDEKTNGTLKVYGQNGEIGNHDAAATAGVQMHYQ